MRVVQIFVKSINQFELFRNFAFTIEMNIALKLRSWSFYVENKYIYCNGVVLEKQILNKNDPNYHKFESISLGDQIALKYIGNQPTSVLENLSDIVLIFTVTDVEAGDKRNPSIKFIFDSVTKCAILQDA